MHLITNYDGTNVQFKRVPETPTIGDMCDCCGRVVLEPLWYVSNEERKVPDGLDMYRGAKASKDTVYPKLTALCTDCKNKFVAAQAAAEKEKEEKLKSDESQSCKSIIRILPYGYVELVDHMGNDYSIAECARESYGMSEADLTPEGLEKLIKGMLKGGHSSPFEQVVFKFKMKMPIFVARQLVRHRMARMNEISARYTELKPEFFIPSKHSFDMRHSAKDIDKVGEKYDELEFKTDMESVCEQSYELYKRAIDNSEAGIGLPKELARSILPIGTYTEFYWQIDGNNLMKILGLRLEEHAQREIYEYALAIYNLVKPIIPVTMKYFISEKFNTITLNSNEISTLLSMLSYKDYTEKLPEDAPTEAVEQSAIYGKLKAAESKFFNRNLDSMISEGKSLNDRDEFKTLIDNEKNNG